MQKYIENLFMNLNRERKLIEQTNQDLEMIITDLNQKIIEINVTSPCYFIKEINNLYGVSLEKILGDYLLTHSLLSL